MKTFQIIYLGAVIVIQFVSFVIWSISSLMGKHSFNFFKFSLEMSDKYPILRFYPIAEILFPYVLLIVISFFYFLTKNWIKEFCDDNDSSLTCGMVVSVIIGFIVSLCGGGNSFISWRSQWIPLSSIIIVFGFILTNIIVLSREKEEIIPCLIGSLFGYLIMVGAFSFLLTSVLFYHVSLSLSFANGLAFAIGSLAVFVALLPFYLIFLLLVHIAIKFTPKEDKKNLF